MKHNNEIPDGNQQVPSTVSTTDDKQVNTTNTSCTGGSRRRFLQGALAAAPVLMTVVSRPVWGNVCAPSGMASGNASHPTDVSVCKTGNGPDTWLSGGVSSWPAPYNENNIRFNDVFGAGPTQQLIQVLNGTGGGTYTPFHKASIAALLNAADGLMGYLGPNPVDVVISIVYNVLKHGYYEPAPGSSWDETDALAYFNLTFANN